MPYFQNSAGGHDDELQFGHDGSRVIITNKTQEKENERKRRKD